MNEDRIISVITATFNSSRTISSLISSLVKQQCRDFEWIVQDGGSTDDTVTKVLASQNELSISLEVAADGGIYDALNRALKRVKTPYYLVVGSDDTLYANCIQDFSVAARNTNADLISAHVDTSKGVLKPGLGSPWLYGQNAYISNHAVGTLIRSDLHKTAGEYSRKLPIAADQLFIKKVMMRPGAHLYKVEGAVGMFGTSGVSSEDVAGLLTECFRVQLLTEKNSLLQIAIFLLKIINNISVLRGKGRP